MKLLTYISLFLLSYIVSGQQIDHPSEIPLYLKHGLEYHEEGEFEKAVQFYEMVPEGDTNYPVALYEKALTLFKMKAYDSAIVACKEGVTLKSELVADFYTCWGSSLNMSKKPQEAIKVLDEGIQAYPYNNGLRKNKAIVYFSNDSLYMAIETIQKAIDLNFVDPTNHVFLGKVYFAQGRTVPAMFAFTTALMFATKGPVAQQALAHLEFLTYRDFPKNEKYFKEDAPNEDKYFAGLEKIIDSRIAIDKGYKIPSKSKEPIVKQLYVLLSQFPAPKDDFVSKTYFPLFQGLEKTDHFKTFSYFILQGYEYSKVDKWISSHTRDINEMSVWLRSRIDDKRRMAVHMVNGYEKEVTQWYYNSGSLYGFGTVDEDDMTQGYWKFMNTLGSLASEGNFVDGKRNGLWKMYSSNNAIRELVEYKDDKLHGNYKNYYSNGELAYDVDYENGKLNGSLKKYYISGSIMFEEHYKNDEIDGYAKYYYKNGQIRIEGNYIDGERDSVWVEYHKNGKKASVVNYVKGKSSGEALFYYNNGQLESVGNHKEGEQVGEYKYYYKNGTLKHVLNFIDDKPEGEVTEYYEDGTKKEIYTLNKGKKEGEASYFDDDGILWYTVLYKGDEMKEYTFFNKDGNVVHSDKVKGRNLELKYFYPQGRPSSLGILTDNLKNGRWLYYHFNGIVSEEYKFENGKYNGAYSYNFLNGNKEIECEYKDGLLNGLYKEYYNNDSLYSTGWFVDDKREGIWKTYYPNGILSAEKYYLNGELSGRERHYHKDGKLHNDFIYEDGLISKIIFYDTLENAIDTCFFINGTGEYYLLYPNGQKSYSTGYKNGLFEGDVKAYFTDGALFAEGNNFYNDYNGRYKVYYHSGQVKHLAYFEYGEKTGEVIWYHDNGQIETKGFYKNNNEDGDWVWYEENGEIDYKAKYKNGENEGNAELYVDGTYVGSIKYSHDIPIAYSYHDKNGELLPFINFPENGTGTIECKYSNGQVSYKQEYVSSFAHGKCLYYYDNGQLLSEKDYINGKKEGPSKVYYKSGALKTERNYFYNSLHGKAVHYYENGNVKREENYLYGEKHGEWKYYEENGKLDKTEHYLYDDQYF